MKRLCSIYRCSKKEGMYLYVDKQDDLASVPDALKKTIGQLELAMTLLITEDKKLAQSKSTDVLQAITDQGYYLQMPPTIVDLQQEGAAIREKNTKL